MFASGLITFREGLEAALIVGILIGYLSKIGQPRQVRFAWVGVILAILASVAAAVGLELVGASLAEPYEQIFEGTTMLLAVAVLTWMIFWMRYQGRFIKRDLEHRVQHAVAAGAQLGILGVAFIAVFREGMETALFLSASAFADNVVGTLTGALVGLTLACAAGYAIYVLSVRLDLKLFFDVTSILLLLFAAGLFANAIHEFQEIGLLPFLTHPAWNLQAFLPNDSTFGSLLGALVGYNDSPTLLQVGAYVAYWGVILIGIRWWTRHLSLVAADSHARSSGLGASRA